MKIGTEYIIIYDDKGHHPMKKRGVVTNIDSNLITLDSGEILNMLFIIRAEPVEAIEDEN